MMIPMAGPILIVDDYQTMNRIMRKMLAELGCNDVDEANGVDDAMGRLRQRRYALVISDWRMEPLDGLELLRQVKSDARLRDTPFLFATAEMNPANIRAGEQFGAIAYITKPFTRDTLRRRLSDVLQKSAA